MRRFTAQAEVELEIPFHDVDMLGVVWHGHYYKYFELARTKLLHEHGLTGQQLTEHGLLLLVIEAKCRYPAPMRFAQRCRIGAAFSDVDYRLKIDYEVWNMTDDRRAAYGHTVLATLNRSGELLLRTPEVLLRHIDKRGGE